MIFSKLTIQIKTFITFDKGTFKIVCVKKKKTTTYLINTFF